VLDSGAQTFITSVYFLFILASQFPEILDSLAVSQKQNEDERVILFCKMASGKSLDSDLILKLKTKIRTLLSPRHVPEIILPIGDIPYTLTGKKVEVVVKKIINGQKVVPSSSLANPESLNLFYGIMELTTSSL
jgi:acetoacetyl-CoA synthetase